MKLKPIVFAMLAGYLPSAHSATIDVMMVYTDGVVARYNGYPQTRFQHLIAVSNQIYTDSQVPLALNLVSTQKVAYQETGSANIALSAITQNTGVFSNIESLRSSTGADMVVMYRTYQSSHGSCGLAWVNPGSNGDFSGTNTKRYMYAHVGVDSCPDFTTAHELGHNMGLKHSRKQDGSGGAFPYALGYGVDGLFTDIMAYATAFNVDYWTGPIYKFSNPNLTCRGMPCGVDKTDPVNGADAASAISVTGPQIANYYSPRNIDLSALQAALDKAKADLATATADVASKTTNVTNLTKSVTTQQALTSATAKSVSTATSNLNKLKTNLTTAQNTLANYNSTLQRLQNSLTTASIKTRDSIQAQITATQQKISAQTTAIQTLSSQINVATTSLQALITTLATQTASLTDLANQMSAAKTALNTAKTALASAQKAYNTALTAFNNGNSGKA